MECDAVRDLMGGWIDRQLAPGEAAALEAHLAICAECRQVADALRAQDAELLRAFQPQRAAAQRLADRVLGELGPVPPVTVAASLLPRWTSLLLAAAAGFLLAVALLRPWKNQAPAIPNPPVIARAAPDEQIVATLVAATGDVEIRPAGTGDWIACADPALVKSFLCPSQSTVRTGPNVRCELRTTEGCVVRLNEDSEITLASANKVEIQRGQIWCSAPENVAFKVVAPDPGQQPAHPAWSFSCPASSCTTTAIDSDGGVQVTASQGAAELQAAHGSQRLAAGESASIVEGRIMKLPQRSDPLVDTGWMRSLLVRKGYDDQELSDHVNQLLARIGRSKVKYLYEQDIRSLGEHGALPLLRYVQSPLSREDTHQRYIAVRILADLAPSWMIGDLLGLLSDEDAELRFSAAQALKRLTGMDQGRPPAQWRESLADCAPTLALWQQWWTENRSQFPTRAARST